MVTQRNRVCALHRLKRSRVHKTQDKNFLNEKRDGVLQKTWQCARELQNNKGEKKLNDKEKSEAKLAIRRFVEKLIVSCSLN